MTQANDETVREVIREIKKSSENNTNGAEKADAVPHRVIVTTFLSHAAV